MSDRYDYQQLTERELREKLALLLDELESEVATPDVAADMRECVGALEQLTDARNKARGYREWLVHMETEDGYETALDMLGRRSLGEPTQEGQLSSVDGAQDQRTRTTGRKIYRPSRPERGIALDPWSSRRDPRD